VPVRPRHAAWNRRAGFWRQWTLWIYFPLALFLVLAGVCLYRSGHWLVAGDAFDKASWAVVLSGESRDGERSDAAVKLYLEGRIDTAIISSVRAYKDRYSGELVTGYLAAEGYPREKLFEFRHDAYSTQEEAALLIRQFRYQNLDTVVIITSNYHSARTRRIFRKLSQGYPQVLVYPAELKDYEPSAWWSGRESRKYWLIEWMKTVSTFFELLNAPPETGKSETDGLTGGISGGAADTFSAPPPPAPDIHPAPADSVPDSSAAPGDTGTLAPSEGRDSARSAAADTVSKPQAADSAAATKEAKEVKEAKETSANKETVRKETKEVKSGAKEAPASKPTGTKAASKPASKKPPEKSKKKTTK
jgi:uncharacterized SAM-binding protein YcdF (DUF218 family)